MSAENFAYYKHLFRKRQTSLLTELDKFQFEIFKQEEEQEQQQYDEEN